MEKKTPVHNLFETECPKEKIRISLGKYITVQEKCLTNKDTGVTSCKYISCLWGKISESSKTVVLKLRSYQRGYETSTPHVLWNYETGTYVEMHGYKKYEEISIESNEGNYRSFRSEYGNVMTIDVVTGEEIASDHISVSPEETEIAYAFVEENGKIVWKIENRKTKKTVSYHKVKKTTINGVDLWMVKRRENDDWSLLHEGKEIATSKTGKFIKKGHYIFGNIENDNYTFYNFAKKIKYDDVILQQTDESIIIKKADRDRVISRAQPVCYLEAIMGFDSSGNYFVNEKRRGYPTLSPENKSEAPERIYLFMDDNSFMPKRSFRDWTVRYFPVGSVHKFLVTDVNSSVNTYLTILQDQDTKAEIIFKTNKKIDDKDSVVYLRVAEPLKVQNVITVRGMENLSFRAFILPRCFYKVKEEDYIAYKNPSPSDARCAKSKSTPAPEKTETTESSPFGNLTNAISVLEALAKTVLSDIEGEISLTIVKDANGNVKVKQ